MVSDVNLHPYSMGTDRAVGMAYPLMLQRGVCEGLGSRGGMVLSRSAWAGSQRYPVATWSGDTNSSFAELRRQVLVSQAVAMSGLYWHTTDIGGYQRG